MCVTCCVHVANVYCSFSRTCNVQQSGSVLPLNHYKKDYEVKAASTYVLVPIRRQSQLKTLIGCFYLVLEVLLNSVYVCIL